MKIGPRRHGIVLDIETSGQNLHKHGILSIGAVCLHNQKTFYGECRLKPLLEIDPEALIRNGFTEDDCGDLNRQTEGALVESFFEWLNEMGRMDGSKLNCCIYGKNPSFDTSFLEAAIDRWELGYFIPYRTIDLHTLASAFALKTAHPFPNEGMSTDNIYKMLGMPEEPKPHNALMGAIMEANAFDKLFTELAK